MTIIYNDYHIKNAKMYNIEDALKYGIEKAILLCSLSKIGENNQQKLEEYFPEIPDLQRHIQELKELNLIIME
jgi:hypothetical protein